MAKSISMNYDQMMKLYGGARAASIKLGLSVQAINLWKKHGIPEVRQKQIQADRRRKLEADGKKR